MITLSRLSAPRFWLVLATLAFIGAVIPSGFWLLATSLNQEDVLAAADWTRCVLLVVGVTAVAAYFSPAIRAVLVSKTLVFILPFVSILLFMLFKRSAGDENELYLAVVREDSVVEYATAALFLISTPIFMLGAAASWKCRLTGAAIFQVATAALMMFMGLEEISYGQRIFGIETPQEIASDNTQGELNLHNLSSLKWIMQDLAPGWIIQWGVLGWLALIVLRLAFDQRSTVLRTAELMLPPWYVFPYFIPFGLWAYHSFWGIWTSAIWQDQEITEMYLALAFLAFSLASAHRLAEWRASDQAPAGQESGVEVATGGRSN